MKTRICILLILVLMLVVGCENRKLDTVAEPDNKINDSETELKSESHDEIEDYSNDVNNNGINECFKDVMNESMIAVGYDDWGKSREELVKKYGTPFEETDYSLRWIDEDKGIRCDYHVNGQICSQYELNLDEMTLRKNLSSMNDVNKLNDLIKYNDENDLPLYYSFDHSTSPVFMGLNTYPECVEALGSKGFVSYIFEGNIYIDWWYPPEDGKDVYNLKQCVFNIKTGEKVYLNDEDEKSELEKPEALKLIKAREVKRDEPERAMRLYKEAAEAGNDEAYIDLADAASTKEEKIGYLEKAAELKNTDAIVDIAFIYLNDDEIDLAVKWLDKGIALGDAEAMNAKAFILNDKGEFKQAFELFKKAAEAGNNDASVYMAGMYSSGQGVEKDVDKAIEILKRVIEDSESNKGTISRAESLLEDLELFYN